VEPDALSDHGAGLPGLADRVVLEHRMVGALRGVRAVGSEPSVGLLRVEGRRGSVGEVATRLRSAVRPGDTVAGLAPGIFAVLCDRSGDRDDLLTIAHRVEEVLSAPPGLDPVIDVVFLDPTDGDPASLLRLPVVADEDTGSGDLPTGRWLRFGGSLRERANRRELIEAALRRTSDGRDLVLAYQPELDLGNGRPAAVEALVRWMRDDRMVAPDEFVPLAERTGLIVPIGAWVMHTACEQLLRWRRAGSAIGTSVAVNVSPRQLLDDGFVDTVDDVLTDVGLPAGDLVLELTEGVLLADLEVARDRLEELRGRGARIAVDDFGTGYASLTYLHRLPVDAVKLDRSFVEGLGVDERLTLIVTAVLGLLQALDLESIAEGVSTEDQAARLRALGCHLAQGSWVGPPASPEELFDRLR